MSLNKITRKASLFCTLCSSGAAIAGGGNAIAGCESAIIVNLHTNGGSTTTMGGGNTLLNGHGHVDSACTSSTVLSMVSEGGSTTVMSGDRIVALTGIDTTFSIMLIGRGFNSQSSLDGWEGGVALKNGSNTVFGHDGSIA